jgi:tetratricopeptide (TPR) repeat protein
MGAKRKIPPPPYRRRSGVEVWGLEVMHEVSELLGYVLWQDLRHLRDWDDARPYKAGKIVVPDRRGDLFRADTPEWIADKRREAALQTPELADALDAFNHLMQYPLAVNEFFTGTACDKVVQWALSRGYNETAMQFSEAAAVIDRTSPLRARNAGKLAREIGDYPRAEVWFERAVGLARKVGNWEEYTRAHLGAGIMFMRSGKERRAQKHFNTASAIAMREGHEWLAAEAQHDLFHFMTVRGRYADGELHARRALAWYPKHNLRFPFFIADVAFLLVCRKSYTPAAKLLREFARKIKPPHSVLGLSLLVRALACAGKDREFARRREHLLRLLEAHTEYEAAARWNLAHGERAMGMWEAATENASRAVQLARARRDNETEGLAQRLLDELRAGTAAPAETHRSDQEFRDFMDNLLSRIADWSPTRRGRPPGESRDDWAA